MLTSQILYSTNFVLTMDPANDPQFDIPTLCKAGVVVNEGPDFRVEIQMVPVPEPGMHRSKWCFASNEQG